MKLVSKVNSVVYGIGIFFGGWKDSEANLELCGTSMYFGDGNGSKCGLGFYLLVCIVECISYISLLLLAEMGKTAIFCWYSCDVVQVVDDIPTWLGWKSWINKEMLKFKVVFSAKNERHAPIAGLCQCIVVPFCRTQRIRISNNYRW